MNAKQKKEYCSISKLAALEGTPYILWGVDHLSSLFFAIITKFIDGIKACTADVCTIGLHAFFPCVGDFFTILFGAKKMTLFDMASKAKA
ncbi:MAG: hypothetical protein PHO30_03235 [Candidatus Omnitrophica bacterium]|jgi:hypothetical protein|nr:hypothetical protein [Candidatus Omnitrophota bacterium]